MELLRTLEGLRSPLLDTIFSYITLLGEETVAIVLLCLIYWCVNKKSAYIIGTAYFISGIAVQGLKIAFRIDRPWIIDPSLNPLASAIPASTGYSFPSGHTQSATALFGSLAMTLRKYILQLLCYLVVLLVAFSRIYLGVHTLLDVGVSLVLTALVVLVVARLFLGDETSKLRMGLLAITMIAIAAAVIAFAATLYRGGTIESSYLTDCLKAAGAGTGFAVGMYIERAYIKFSVRSKNLLWQALKYVIGLAGVLLLKEGLKLVLGTGFVVDPIRYFLVCTWVTVFYPLIIKRFFELKKPAAGEAALTADAAQPAPNAPPA